ncbi:hypothetical protein I204_04225 [Kwoniella mangroviensis CBS 8886]|nr:hypothetical protein I204_04225 [Kwoniella mangroviensis CBS 8886]
MSGKVIHFKRYNRISTPEELPTAMRLGMEFERRAEPHLSNNKNAGDQQEEDWFQNHSTQVFLIFGSILFIITLLCLYCLTRKQGSQVLPSCMKRHKKAKARSGRNSHRPISNASSINGLLSLDRSRSRDLNNHAIVGGMRIDDEDGQGMGRMRMWQNTGREDKRLWRKTAYMSDLRHATKENSKNYQKVHGRGDFDEGFPDGFERVTRDTFYQPTKGGQGHKRNTTLSSFGHPPSSSFYDYSESSPSPYSVYDASGLVRPISNYIPYNPILTSTESLRYPPSVKRPITDYRRSFVSHMSNDPGYLEDLKAGSHGRKSGSYYPKSPASTYVPPRESVYSWRSYPHEEDDYEKHHYNQAGRHIQMGHQYDQIQPRHQHHDANYHQYDQNQGYHIDQIQSLHPNHDDTNSYLNPSPIEYEQHEYTPKPSIDQSIVNDYTAYTQPQPLANLSHSPQHLENSLDEKTPSTRPRHERTPSMGSIKFPEPEPSPAPAPILVGDGMISPYTRSSTYSFPAPPTGEGQFEFRLSTQPKPSGGTFNTYDYDYQNQHQQENYQGEGEEGEEEEGDSYSPSRTEVNTKLNSASYHSPSLISKHSRISTVPGQTKLSNSISRGFDDSDGLEVTPRKEKRNSSGPSLAKSDNPNPSPNFPPPSNLIIDTTSSIINSDTQEHTITTSSSSGGGGGGGYVISTMSKKIQRVKPPSLLKSTLPPKSPKSPSPLRYSSTFDMDDMPIWMKDNEAEAEVDEEPVPRIRG